jgi:hypothetical protein
VLVDGSAGNITDFDLRLMSDTGALIEYDDADNDEAFGISSPNIAGAPLTGSAAFLKITTKGQRAEPYRVFSVVQPPLSTATPEVEPNDSIAQYNEGLNNYFYGNLAAPGPSSDVDVYRFDAEAGTLIFVSLDGNPQRTTHSINAKLQLLDADGNLLLQVDDSSPASPPPGEALVYRVIDDGFYFVRVSISPNATSANGAGDYLLSISKNGFIGSCGCNNAPSLAGVSMTTPVYAQSSSTLTGSVVDYDIGQIHQVTVNWGDGSPATTTNLAAGVALFTISHFYAQANPNLGLSIVVADAASATASTNINVTVQSQPANPRLTTMTASNGGHVPLQVEGTPGVTYRIQTSADSQSWTNLMNAPVGADGFFHGEDPAPPSVPQRFYRARWP